MGLLLSAHGIEISGCFVLVHEVSNEYICEYLLDTKLDPAFLNDMLVYLALSCSSAAPFQPSS